MATNPSNAVIWNPLYLDAAYEIRFTNDKAELIGTPNSPEIWYRYDDLDAAMAHLQTGKPQPQTIQPFITE